MAFGTKYTELKQRLVLPKQHKEKETNQQTTVTTVNYSYVCLHHMGSVCSEGLGVVKDVNSFQFLHLLQHGIDDNVGPCATNTSTERQRE